MTDKLKQPRYPELEAVRESENKRLYDEFRRYRTYLPEWSALKPIERRDFRLVTERIERWAGDVYFSHGRGKANLNRNPCFEIAVGSKP